MPDITTSWAKTMQDLTDTFSKWNVDDWETRPMRELDKRQHWQGDPAKVTLRFVLRGDTVTLDSLAQPYYFQNLRVLYFAVEAMRLNEVRGLTNIMRDAYLQLQAPKTKRDPWEVLGLRPDADSETVDAVFRSKAKRLHPDVGGDPDAFKELNEAYEQVKQA